MADFPKKYRLASKLDFQSVFTKPRKFSYKYLFILFRPNQLTHPRLGVILNKHQLKTAVLRNRFRRLVRESFRGIKDDMPNYDIILLLRGSTKGLDKKTIRDDMDGLWVELMKK